MDWIWKTIVIYFAGTFILRLGGRKSIGQMNASEVIVVLGIGTLFVQPIVNEDLAIAFGSSLILIILMIALEYLETKIDFVEDLLEGKAVIVIENGKPNLKNLKRLRMTVDLLEAKLRQYGISSIEDVKYATIESTGQLGYELMDSKKLATKEDINILIKEVLQIKDRLQEVEKLEINTIPPSDKENNIFEEVKYKRFEGNKKEP